MIGTCSEPSRNRPVLQPLPRKTSDLVSAPFFIIILIKGRCALLTRAHGPLISIIKGGLASLPGQPASTSRSTHVDDLPVNARRHPVDASRLPGRRASTSRSTLVDFPVNARRLLVDARRFLGRRASTSRSMRVDSRSTRVNLPVDARFRLASTPRRHGSVAGLRAGTATDINGTWFQTESSVRNQHSNSDRSDSDGTEINF